MSEQKLTPEQQEQVEKILADYRKELDEILAHHRIQVKEILDRLDKQKMEDLMHAIQGKS